MKCVVMVASLMLAAACRSGGERIGRVVDGDLDHRRDAQRLMLALQEQPSDAGLVLAMADANAQAGDIKSACRVLDETWDRTQDPRIALARAHLESDPERLLTLARRAAENPATRGAASKLLAECHLRRGEHAEAARFAREHIERDPSAVQGWALLALACLGDGDLDGASRAAEQWCTRGLGEQGLPTGLVVLWTRMYANSPWWTEMRAAIGDAAPSAPSNGSTVSADEAARLPRPSLIRAWLGFTRWAADESGALEAGWEYATIQPGDRLVALAGAPVATPADVARMEASLMPGSRLAIDVIRRGERIALEIPVSTVGDQCRAAMKSVAIGCRMFGQGMTVEAVARLRGVIRVVGYNQHVVGVLSSMAMLSGQSCTVVDAPELREVVRASFPVLACTGMFQARKADALAAALVSAEEQAPHQAEIVAMRGLVALAEGRQEDAERAHERAETLGRGGWPLVALAVALDDQELIAQHARERRLLIVMSMAMGAALAAPRGSASAGGNPWRDQGLESDAIYGVSYQRSQSWLNMTK